MVPAVLQSVLTLLAAYAAFLVLCNWWELRGRSWWIARRRATLRRIAALPRPGGSNRAGFTLVEVLVVIAIIAVLIAILMPAIGKARQSALRLKAMTNMRELLLGYTQYHIDNKGALCFGYTPPTVNGSPVIVADPVSKHQFGFPVADRYPWRLVKYCSNVWGILNAHEGVPPIPSQSDSAAEAFGKAYVLSINPSFGINAIYLGGHVGFSGFAGPSGDKPNTGKHVAFRANEIRRPAEMIVFAESLMRNVPGSTGDTGLHFVTPPRAKGQKWRVENERFVLTSGMITGVPQGRYGTRAVVGFFDGHAEQRLPSELEDMRLWAPFATKRDYDYAP